MIGEGTWLPISVKRLIGFFLVIWMLLVVNIVHVIWLNTMLIAVKMSVSGGDNRLLLFRVFKWKRTCIIWTLLTWRDYFYASSVCAAGDVMFLTCPSRRVCQGGDILWQLAVHFSFGFNLIWTIVFGCIVYLTVAMYIQILYLAALQLCMWYWA